MFFQLIFYDQRICTVSTTGRATVMQFTPVALDLPLCVMTYPSRIGTFVVLLLLPHLPCILHSPHPLCIFLLLFVHILLFS